MGRPAAPPSPSEPQYGMTNGNVGGTGAASAGYAGSLSNSACANTRTGPPPITTPCGPGCRPLSSVSATVRPLLTGGIRSNSCGRLPSPRRPVRRRGTRRGTMPDEDLLANPVLVTGASGFIGSAVVRALLGAGGTVRALVEPGRDVANLDGLAAEQIA